MLVLSPTLKSYGVLISSMVAMWASLAVGPALLSNKRGSVMCVETEMLATKSHLLYTRLLSCFPAQ